MKRFDYRKRSFAMLAAALVLLSGCTILSSKSNNTSLGKPNDKNTSIGTSSSIQSKAGEFPYYNSTVNFSSIPAEASKNASSAKKAASSAKASSGKSTAVSSANNPSASNSSTGSYTPVLHNEMKAMWISYLELNSNPRLLQDRSAELFRANIVQAYEKCLSIGVNTVFVHVRPFGDAVYPSALFPSSEAATSSPGTALSYDPLAIMIDEAHKKGISFHAWINPYRAQSASKAADIAGKAPSTQFAKWYKDSSKNGDYLVNVGGRYYYNPSVPEVRQLLIDGVEEILKHYQVDGIHIDDYFYPSGIDENFDKAAYQRYLQRGGKLSLADFRRDCNNQAVREIYQKIKSINSKVVFSVSPSGNISYNYSTMFADVELWLKTQGYLDLIIPQIYYGFKNAAAPYSQTVATWNGLVKVSSVKMAIGLAAYKVGNTDAYAGAGVNEWIDDAGNILASQIAQAKTQSHYAGYAFFDYKSLFYPDAAKSTMIQQEISKLS